MYHLYILLCSDNSLYTGITNNLSERMESHRSGQGSKYVRSRLPFRRIYTEKCKSRSSAQKREAEIKSWTRRQKIRELGLGIST